MTTGKRTVLGFDYGTRRIGVAVGQEITHTVTPLTTLTSKTDTPDWAAIRRLIEEWQPALLIVGLPLHMDGTEQPLTQRARRFGNQLKGRYNLPVELVDERLTSYEAEQLLDPRQSKAAIDALAAQLIVQSWFDQQQQQDNA